MPETQRESTTCAFSLVRVLETHPPQYPSPFSNRLTPALSLSLSPRYGFRSSPREMKSPLLYLSYIFGSNLTIWVPISSATVEAVSAISLRGFSNTTSMRIDFQPQSFFFGMFIFLFVSLFRSYPLFFPPLVSYIDLIHKNYRSPSHLSHK